jgi:hypothetical protein
MTANVWRRGRSRASQPNAKEGSASVNEKRAPVTTVIGVHDVLVAVVTGVIGEPPWVSGQSPDRVI